MRRGESDVSTGTGFLSWDPQPPPPQPSKFSETLRLATMVKRQKEKQYQSAREHRSNSKLRAGTSSSSVGSVQRKLPFDCCALSLTPFEHPVCSPQGVIFENTTLLSFLLKHRVDPVSGKPLSSRDVITLNMDKNEEGKWQCPVLTKPFSSHSKIVAVRQPGTNEANVFSYEAYHELNVKGKNYEDLLSGVKFSPKRDVIILNDPANEELNELRDINNFHHIREGRTLEASQPTNRNVQHSVTASRIMEKIQQKKREAPSTKDKEDASSKKLKIFSDAVGVRQTSGKMSGSLTSTSMDVSHGPDIREATQEEILTAQFRLMRKRKKKGYVTLHTNIGDIGLELHCDMVPRTCTNFLGLAEQKKYDGTKFHRLIRNFMIQGGKASDPKEDTSLWGEPFVDEFDDRLKHTGAGVLSMANAGPRTNKRQFFITFKSCNHLDRKHSVFGKVVEGIEVLQSMEQVPTDKKDRPSQEIKILSVEVLVNPAKEAEEAENARLQEAAITLKAEQDARKAAALGRKLKPNTAAVSAAPLTKKKEKPVIGKYLPKAAVHASSKAVSSDEEDGLPAPNMASRLPPPPKKTSFGNFSGW